MITVLIVDDEKLIREGIANCIDWYRLNCKLLGTAENGLEGLEKIRELKPSLVITDIRMPRMNGLDMIKHTQDIIHMPEYIILSGYDDFDFACKALEYGVRRYLLKPIDVQELEEKILEIVNNYIITDSVETTGNELVDKIISHIYTNYNNKELNIGWISENLVFNNSDYLGRLFKKYTNRTFHTFLTEWRISKAKNLLERKGMMKIYEIAEECGFPPDGQYFSTMFKKVTGLSPGKYRSKGFNESILD